ncbi:MAG: hypothetical protein ABL919_05860 [Methylococcales bacterium]
MKTYRKMCLFLMSLAMALFMPSGFAKTTDSAIANVDVPRQSRASKKHKPKNTVVTAPQITADKEQQKALDLSLSIENLEKSPLLFSPSPSIEVAPNSIFTATPKPPRTLLLDGQLIMSPEPEADKKKSMDGAGISINLKR